ncbi:MAG: hypothetical protein VB089_09490 [Anaerolineaceae bacterium]|nr:hypothetical protein [Anaerolineaceae bacterium]
MKAASRPKKDLSLLWAILFFSALTVWMTWPLATRMQDWMVGQMGDNVYFVWMIGWMKKALFELHVNPFDVWFLNYPEGWNMAYTEITPIMLALALPFSFLGGATFAYNMAMMLSFVLSGLGMYLWVRYLTGRSDAALVAGTIFAFVPYHFAHFLIGHLNLSGTQWFPFYFLGLFQLLEGRDAAGWKQLAWKPAVLAGVTLGLIALTSQYYVYMALIVSAFLVALDVLLLDRSRLKNLGYWRNLVVMGLVSLPLVLVAIAPYVSLSQQGGLPDRNLGIVRLYSASPTDFLLPSTDHFLWGAWIGSHFNRDMWVEGTLYIGIVSLALGGIAWWQRKALNHSRTVVWLLWGALFAMVLAMGTDLHWLGQPVELNLPAFLAERLHRDTLPLILPGYVLFQYFPFYAKLRALMRFGVFVLVFSAAAAGLGAAWVLQRVRPAWRLGALVSLLALVCLDFYPGPYQEFTHVEPRPVDYWLAAQPGDGALIQFPFIEGEDQEQTYYTLVHGKPFVGGFFNAFPPAQYSRLKPIMEAFPDQQSIDLLPELGVEYVLVHADQYPDLDALRQVLEANGIHYVDEMGGQMIFELTPTGGTQP